jgi:hypothetical protein
MSTFPALVVTSTANSPKIADRASLQVTTVLVAMGVIAFSCGMNSVPKHVEALPTSSATSRRHAVLRERRGTEESSQELAM